MFTQFYLLDKTLEFTVDLRYSFLEKKQNNTKEKRNKNKRSFLVRIQKRKERSTTEKREKGKRNKAVFSLILLLLHV